MSLNKGSLDLGAEKSSRTNQGPLSSLVHTIHRTRQIPICIQCLTAPAFEVRRRAVKSASLSIETTKGKAQTRNLTSQLRSPARLNREDCLQNTEQTRHALPHQGPADYR